MAHNAPFDMEFLRRVEGQIDLLGPVGEVIRIGDVITRALGQDDFPLPSREAHDKATDAEAISYHYDLSNEFYRLWLDRDMVYSCAYFRKPDMTLAMAQEAKLEHIRTARNSRRLQVRVADVSGGQPYLICNSERQNFRASWAHLHVSETSEEVN